MGGFPNRIMIPLYLNFDEFLNLYKRAESDGIDPDDPDEVNIWVKKKLGVAA